MRIKIQINSIPVVCKRTIGFIFCSLFLLISLYKPVLSQIKSDIFLQNYTAFLTDYDSEIIAGRNRANIKLQYPFSFGNIHSEIELLHQFRENLQFKFILRELYADLYFKDTDIRLGYQRVTWGRAHGSFISDILSPVDFRDFTYSDLSELRIPILALNTIRYFGSNSLQLILHPAQQTEVLPDQNSRWFPVPNMNDAFQLSIVEGNQKKQIESLNAAINFRLRSTDSLDAEFFLLYWQYPVPALGYELESFSQSGPINLTLRTDQRSSLMAGTGAFLRLSDRSGIVTELLFIANRSFTELPFDRDLMDRASNDNLLALQLFNQFQNRDDYYITNRPWIHSMAGLSSEVAGYSFSLQAHAEWILNYNSTIISEALFPYITLLLNRSFFRDRIHLVALNRYNLKGDDFWIQIEGRVEWSDQLELSLGTNLFGGIEPDPLYGHLSFNQFRNNSFIFSKLTFYL